MKTTSKKKNLFLIPLKFWGKPFLGLAQLSQIFDYLLFLCAHDVCSMFVFLCVWYPGNRADRLPDTEGRLVS